MSKAASRFDELVPGWLFIVRPAWARALVAVAVGGLAALPLAVADRPDQMRLAPTLVVALVVVAAVAGWWPVLTSSAIVVPAYWYWGIPPAGSFQLDGLDDAVALGGLTVLGTGLAVLTVTIQRSVHAVRELDTTRQLESLAEATERLDAQLEVSQVRAALDLSVRLAEVEGRDAVARAALEALSLPTAPTSASVAVVEGTRLRVLAAKGAHPRSIEILEQVDITASDWLRQALGGTPAYVDDRERFAAEHPDAGVLRLYPAGSWAVVPFRSEGTVGLLSVHYLVPLELTSYDAYFSLVAEILATALQRATGDEQRLQYLAELEQSFAERDRIARTLSTTLVPTRLPSLPDFRSAGWLIPASPDEVAGDFYDLFALPDGDWVAVLGDVCGKGAEAAAVTSLARYAARVTALSDPDPVHIAETVNNALTLDQSELFCTMAIVRHAHRSNAVDLTLAGHPQVRLLRDGVVTRGGTFGAALGLGPRPYRSDRVTLEPGDAVVLFSDGLIERNRHFGEDELDAALATCRGNAPQIADQLRAIVSGLEVHRRDDLAVLVISRS